MHARKSLLIALAALVASTEAFAQGSPPPSGGVTVTAAAGRPGRGVEDLATLADISAGVRVTPRLTSTLYFGWANGGDVVERIYPGGNSARFGYLELEYRR